MDDPGRGVRGPLLSQEMFEEGEGDDPKLPGLPIGSATVPGSAAPLTGADVVGDPSAVFSSVISTAVAQAMRPMLQATGAGEGEELPAAVTPSELQSNPFMALMRDAVAKAVQAQSLQAADTAQKVDNGPVGQLSPSLTQQLVGSFFQHSQQ